MPETDLIISIVNINNKPYVKRCLQSIFKNTQNILFNVCVINNISTDGSIEMIEKEFPQVSLMKCDKLQTFSKNHNDVLKRNKGSRYYMLLNDDMVVRENALEELVRFMDEHPEIGICAPKGYNEDGTLGAIGRNYYNPVDFILTTLAISRRMFKKIIDESKIEGLQYWETDVVGGGSLFFRKELIEGIGYLDEKLLIYNEEEDYCRRAKSKNWKIAVVGDAEIMHFHSITIKKMPLLVEKYAYQSNLYFLKKYYGPMYSNSLKLIYQISFIVKIIHLYIQKIVRSDKDNQIELQISHKWNLLRLKINL